MGDSKTKEERRLAKGCIEGDARCQKTLFQKYYGLMLSICLRYAGSREEAKDILQDGFVKIFNNISNFNFQGSLEGWMKRIMINTAIDNYRKMNNQPYSVDIEEAHDLGKQEDISQDINRQDLLKLVQELPDGYRTVFNLYIIEGYNHLEIGKMLGISEGTSKSQLSKARKFLQKKIQETLMYDNE